MNKAKRTRNRHEYVKQMEKEPVFINGEINIYRVWHDWCKHKKECGK